MKQEISNKPVIVLHGMHRSGSSLSARALQVPGDDPGECLLLPIDGDNDKGLREDIDINDVDNHLLDNMGRSRDRLTRLVENEQTYKLAAQRRASVPLLNNKMRSAEHFGSEDPRTAILLPFRKTVFQKFELDISYVITARASSASPVPCPIETICR